MDKNHDIHIPLMADLAANNKTPEFLLWIGCAGAYDERYQKVIHALITVLSHASIDFAVLGPEESCTGDPARRAGNELLFQMQALSNIQILNNYKVKKIITPCPHCYNTFKNEYPALGGNYQVIHHAELLDHIISENPDYLSSWDNFEGKKITYHDSCYLGRSNNIYDQPRQIIESLNGTLTEMGRNKEDGLCCGAGGSQMFKEAEKGKKEIYIERTEEVLKTKAEIVATACPFCLTMLSDGIKTVEKEDEILVLDVVELFNKAAEKSPT
jgi:Fe-S oxidoreductase